MGINEGDFLWQPDAAFADQTRLASFMRWLAQEHGLAFETYDELRQWSVDSLDHFWTLVWSFFRIESETPFSAVLSKREMPGAEWFPGSKLNYAEHLLRNERERPDDVVLFHSSEVRALARTTWRELARDVRALATALRTRGVMPGDRVIAYLPNIPEAVTALLATAAIGAVWSSAAPEFGAQTVIDRFSQIAPTVLFAADGYSFGGKVFDRRGEIAALVKKTPSLQAIVWLEYVGLEAPSDLGVPIEAWRDLVETNPSLRDDDFRFTRVGSRHPVLDSVLLGHHWFAEGDRAFARRNSPRATEGRRLSSEYRTIVHSVLLLHNWLDDVECVDGSSSQWRSRRTL